MTTTEPPGTVELLVDLLTENATGQALCDWATSALAAGYDGESLRQLAGLDVGQPASLFDAEPLLTRVLVDLGSTLREDRAALLRRYEHILARQLLDHERSVEDVLELIHSRVVGPLSHAWEVFPWCLLWEGNDPYDIDQSLLPADLEARARDYAAEVVSGEYPTQLAKLWAAKRRA